MQSYTIIMMYLAHDYDEHNGPNDPDYHYDQILSFVEWCNKKLHINIIYIQDICEENSVKYLCVNRVRVFFITSFEKEMYFCLHAENWAYFHWSKNGVQVLIAISDGA